jgi:quercetin dioxygenase-like cupin family protein
MAVGPADRGAGRASRIALFATHIREEEEVVSRIGNRTYPGRCSVGVWKELEAKDAQRDLEQHIVAFERLSVVRCVYREGADFPEHFHPQEQITIVEEGALEFQIGEDLIRVGEGQTIAIEPEVRHATRVANGSARAVALNIFLKNPSVHRHSAHLTGIRTIRPPAR